MENKKKNLDSFIPKTNITYREQLELAISDSRGINFELTDELNEINGAIEYAKKRKKFWTEWNKSYERVHGSKNMNTQERYIFAQKVSKIYAISVYKNICNIVARKVSETTSHTVDNAMGLLQFYLYSFLGGSLLMMQNPLKSVNDIISIVKNINFPIGVMLEIKLKGKSNNELKNWIKEVA